DDMAIISNIARYHRRAGPQKSHLPYMALDSDARVLVNKLGAILRVANALDADHLQKVRGVKVRREDALWVLAGDGAAPHTLERLAALALSGLLQAPPPARFKPGLRLRGSPPCCRTRRSACRRARAPPAARA
ncbi:MAG: hypothetical protein ACHP85_01680, partial [Burkholderiales bacterium]